MRILLIFLFLNFCFSCAHDPFAGKKEAELKERAIVECNLGCTDHMTGLYDRDQVQECKSDCAAVQDCFFECFKQRGCDKNCKQKCETACLDKLHEDRAVIDACKVKCQSDHKCETECLCEDACFENVECNNICVSQIFDPLEKTWEIRAKRLRYHKIKNEIENVGAESYVAKSKVGSKKRKDEL